MSEMEEVEVDPSKTCMMRFGHRSIEGVDRDGNRLCPACFPAKSAED